LGHPEQNWGSITFREIIFSGGAFLGSIRHLQYLLLDVTCAVEIFILIGSRIGVSGSDSFEGAKVEGLRIFSPVLELCTAYRGSLVGFEAL
jgi:hypothetical protein